MKKIIIIIVVIVLAFIGYSYLISGKNSGSSSGVTKQAVGTTSTSNNSNALGLDGPGKEFVTQLLAIQNIRFNLNFFIDPVFQGLKDWSQEIAPQESGRPNPFAPVNQAFDAGKTTTGFNGNIDSTSTAINTGTSTGSNTSRIQTGTSARTTNTTNR